VVAPLLVFLKYTVELQAESTIVPEEVVPEKYEKKSEFTLRSERSEINFSLSVFVQTLELQT